MKPSSCGRPVKRPFVCRGGARSCVRVRLTEYPVKLSKVFGSSCCDQLQRQQTLGKGKPCDWQLLRKTKMLEGRAPFWQEHHTAQELQAGQHWSFYCVGDDWTVSVNSDRQLLSFLCFKEMLDKCYRLGERLHRGHCLVRLFIILEKTKTTLPHTLQFPPLLSLACNKTSHIRRLQRVSRSESLLIDSTCLFGLVAALSKQQRSNKHMVCQNINWFWLLALSLTRITTLDE